MNQGEKTPKKWASISIQWDDGQSTFITQQEVAKMVEAAVIAEQLGNAVAQAKRLKDIHMEM